MARKARKKTAAKSRKKAKAAPKRKAKVRAKAAAKKSKTRRRKARKAKPQTIGGRIASAYRAVIESVEDTQRLRKKYELPGSSETE